MDPIVGNSTSLASHQRRASLETISVEAKASSNKSTLDNGNSLTDISSLAKDSASSGADIRKDVIARAEKLLADPNWLSDQNLDLLAEKIISEEEF